MPEIEFFGLSFCKILEFLENFIEFLGNSSKFMITFAKILNTASTYVQFFGQIMPEFFFVGLEFEFSPLSF